MYVKVKYLPIQGRSKRSERDSARKAHKTENAYKEAMASDYGTNPQSCKTPSILEI